MKKHLPQDREPSDQIQVYFTFRVKSSNINWMRLLLFLISVCLITFGLLGNTESVAIAGSIVLVLSQATSLLDIYKGSKKYSENLKQVNNFFGRKDVTDTLISWSGGIVILLGIIGLLESNNNKTSFNLDIMTTPAVIVWFGSIAIYFLAGVVSSTTTGIPMKFGYSGWYVNKTRKIKKNK